MVIKVPGLCQAYSHSIVAYQLVGQPMAFRGGDSAAGIIAVLRYISALHFSLSRHLVRCAAVVHMRTTARRPIRFPVCFLSHVGTLTRYVTQHVFNSVRRQLLPAVRAK
jgi:hypothetical protein